MPNRCPSPKTFSHADVYPNFAVWGWEVTSGRRRPGFTVIENASAAGFRCAVREWVPGGATLPEVKLSIATPPHSFAPAQVPSRWPTCGCATATCGAATLKADGQGRLSFDLDGDASEVAIGEPAAPLPVAYEIDGASLGDRGASRFICMSNSGTRHAASPTAGAVTWESPERAWIRRLPTPSVCARAGQIGRSSAYGHRERSRPAGPSRNPAVVRIRAARWRCRCFRPREPFADFLLADGTAVEIFQQATGKVDLTLGDGNGDG